LRLSAPTYRKARTAYETALNVWAVTRMHRDIGKIPDSGTDKNAGVDEKAFAELMQEIERPLAKPDGDPELPAEVRVYLDDRFLQLQNMQQILTQKKGTLKTSFSKEGGKLTPAAEVAKADGDIQTMLNVYRTGNTVRPKDLETLLGTMVTYVSMRDQYEAVALRAPKEVKTSEKLTHFLIFAGGLEAAQKAHNAFRTSAEPKAIEDVRLDRAKPEAIRQLEGRGVRDANKVLDQAVSIVKKAPAEGRALFGEMVRLSPIDALLCAYFMHISEDKIRAATGFALMFGSCVAANRYLVASKNVPGPPMVKFAVVLATMFMGGEKLDAIATGVSKYIPDSPVKTGLNDTLSVVDLPFDYFRMSVNTGGGVRVGARGDDMRYLSSRVVLNRVQNDHGTWNDAVTTRQEKQTDPTLKALYEEEKIDLPTPASEGGLAAYQEIFKDGPAWKEKADKSRWVSRQRTQFFMQYVQVHESAKRFAGKLEAADMPTFDPPILTFLVDPNVPLDERVTIDEQLKRQYSGYGKGPMTNYDKVAKAIDKSGDAVLLKDWENVKTQLSSLGLQLTVYRRLHVFDREQWLGDIEAIGTQSQKLPPAVRIGMIDTITYDQKRKETLEYKTGNAELKEYGKTLSGEILYDKEDDPLSKLLERLRPIEGPKRSLLLSQTQAALETYMKQMGDMEMYAEESGEGDAQKKEMKRIQDEVNALLPAVTKHLGEAPSEKELEKLRAILCTEVLRIFQQQRGFTKLLRGKNQGEPHVVRSVAELTPMYQKVFGPDLEGKRYQKIVAEPDYNVFFQTGNPRGISMAHGIAALTCLSQPGEDRDKWTVTVYSAFPSLSTVGGVRDQQIFKNPAVTLPFREWAKVYQLRAMDLGVEPEVDAPNTDDQKISPSEKHLENALSDLFLKYFITVRADGTHVKYFRMGGEQRELQIKKINGVWKWKEPVEKDWSALTVGYGAKQTKEDQKEADKLNQIGRELAAIVGQEGPKE